ncbi:hypothetical protein VSU01S_26660 [Vibrio superstes NBRC 103154]|uniref:Sigma-54 factor interaction domain-containing protein n=1 Tax=Vibrio superstes NBRC 103154 TaxID=1219062 RepID=A0A511QSX0_9VIBR|nr:hypothetical protein VSU01S_26660 [Vibrio superstes NBRC 103154]
MGDDSNTKVNVRIIATTNRVIHEEVKEGHFRSDLYHRLSVFPLFFHHFEDEMMGFYYPRRVLQIQSRS